MIMQIVFDNFHRFFPIHILYITFIYLFIYIYIIIVTIIHDLIHINILVTIQLLY